MEDTVLAIAAALFLGLLAVLYYCVTSAVVPKALEASYSIFDRSPVISPARSAFTPPAIVISSA